MTRCDRESRLERDAMLYAEMRGWWQAKFVSPGLRSVPDRVLIRNGRVIFIEFKRGGEDAVRQQALRHKRMRKFGAEVFLIDTLEEAKEILK